MVESLASLSGIHESGGGVENSVTRMIDDIIVSELRNDPGVDVVNWESVSKRRISFGVYCKISDLLRDVFVLDSLTTAFLYLFSVLSITNSLRCGSVASVACTVSLVYSVSVFKKERRIVCGMLAQEESHGRTGRAAEAARSGRITQAGYRICDIIGIISRFAEKIDSVVFCLAVHRMTGLLSSSAVALLLVVKLSLLAIDVRLLAAISNCGEAVADGTGRGPEMRHDNFMIGNMFETFFSKGQLSHTSALGGRGASLGDVGRGAKGADARHVRPLKITQMSDFVFNLNLYTLERKLYDDYIINTHKETHEFNTSTYFIWKTLSHEVPLNAAKLLLALFYGESETLCLILSLALSVAKTLAVFLHLFVNKDVVNDVFG